MKNIITYLVFCVFIVLAGCSSVSVSYDYDKNADFKKFKTYAFDENVAKLPVLQIVRDRITAAIDREMQARGYTKSDTPDLLVDVYAKLEQGETATATTTGTGMYGPWRYGYGGGFTTTSVSVEKYVDGTLFINVIDKSQEKIIWQGRGTKTLDEDSSPQKREDNINNAVKLIFEKYPVQPPKK